jgi:hypothetical protein
MSITDLTKRLKEAEEAFEEAPTSLQQDGKLYLTKEEWGTLGKKHEVENHSGGDDIGKGHVRDDSSSGESSNKPTGDEYQRCDKMGHWACECRSKSKKE